MLEENQNNQYTNPANNNLELMGMVSNIIAAYVSNHTVEVYELPGLMKQVQQSLWHANSKLSLPSPGLPAVPIEESITPDYIICLEDGKKMKMLKRHLKTAYNMTPEQYRERWKPPAIYPMTAPNYTKKRQGIAKTIGLGKIRTKVA